MTSHPSELSETGPPVRLFLTPSGAAPYRIDGAWWPRTDDLIAELPPLLSALPFRWARIVHVTVDATAWSAFPGRMLCAGHVLHLHADTRPRTPTTACLVAPGSGRWDLTVVPPRTDEAQALRLMADACARQ
ncbi:DUF5994 family protein [Streptomyces sp. cg28]|uniref:DUF5994 family protein n=1 Tax=Streptomyces sp. cg28 TaxID=3403457 RepID=UPI003B2231AA